MAKLGETSVPPSVKVEALNIIENLLIEEVLSIEEYEIISKVLKESK